MYGCFPPHYFLFIWLGPCIRLLYACHVFVCSVCMCSVLTLVCLCMCVCVWVLLRIVCVWMGCAHTRHSDGPKSSHRIANAYSLTALSAYTVAIALTYTEPEPYITICGFPERIPSICCFSLLFEWILPYWFSCQCTKENDCGTYIPTRYIVMRNRWMSPDSYASHRTHTCKHTRARCV